MNETQVMSTLAEFDSFAAVRQIVSARRALVDKLPAMVVTCDCIAVFPHRPQVDRGHQALRTNGVMTESVMTAPGPCGRFTLGKALRPSWVKLEGAGQVVGLRKQARSRRRDACHLRELLPVPEGVVAGQAAVVTQRGFIAQRWESDCEFHVDA